ncbi:MAG: peptide ABC transporter substrate-binding protein [Patescibacteria group bacterium]
MEPSPSNPQFNASLETTSTSGGSLHTHHTLPGLSFLEKLLRYFSPFERVLLYGFSLLLAVSTFFLVVNMNTLLTSDVPAPGGTYTEGIVGTPRFVNPLLATSDADRDIVALTYSGLMRATPDDTFIPDLAEHVDISEDGMSYTFTLRPDAVFHDGTPVTARDVVFTVALAQSPDTKSPRRPDWEGVTVEAPDDRTVHITLPHPYAPFIETATLGILPAHLWQNVAPTDFPFHALNTNPIGSGPYAVDRVRIDSSGTPTRMSLKASKTFTLGKPFITTIILDFYPNADELIRAITNGSVEGAGGVATARISEITPYTALLRSSLPRIFALFLNPDKATIFADAPIRSALEQSVDRGALVNDNLNGYGVSVKGPVIPASVDKNTGSTTPLTGFDPAAARAKLEAAGWKPDETGLLKKKGASLEFSISTSDAPELAGVADSLARSWRSIGADVHVKVFSASDLTNAVIRPRDYQALLFGEVIGRNYDLYPFWHSSQRNDPGLNLSLYANAKADKLLSEIRKESNRRARATLVEEFVAIVAEDKPAIFLFAPEFVYALPHDMMGVRLGSLGTPSERFGNVYEWYRKTERVWDIFIK